ncbi:MAG: xylose isomerase, partial [Lachnospiraceae bacterium]|nr:xylose isomerase [Lachnospiraceae bacterium]
EMIEDGRLEKNVEERYASFESELGKKVRNGEATLEELAQKAADMKAPAIPVSGRQEYLESVLNNIILSNN